MSDLDPLMTFSHNLISWYHKNKRDLPWRKTDDLYHIWVSEIIMQQTRVAQGTQYYHRFLERFPDIISLVEADESEVLKIWQGLGYYSRARNMHEAARQILNDHNGIFPSDYKSLIKIKGIGSYTAAALLSFGYNLPYPVIDGNVKRILSRLFAIDQPINSPKAETLFIEKLNTIFDTKNPADFNQAIMEFGALQCKPGLPDCPVCVFNKICIANKQGTVGQYPLIAKKAAEIKRYLYYIVPVFYRGTTAFTFIQKRSANDIWKNLYEFPLIEANRALSVEEVLMTDEFIAMFPQEYKVKSASAPLVHKLTHRTIHARFIWIELKSPLKKTHLPEIKLSDIRSLPVSRLTDKYLNSINYFGL
ncbi:MAG: A/G-specific adenine glycosylase [Bacteroidota bacterium]